jgi:hypothetical protein
MKNWSEFIKGWCIIIASLIIFVIPFNEWHDNYKCDKSTLILMMFLIAYFLYGFKKLMKAHN